MIDELQTFRIDPQSVNGAQEVLVTSIELFFRRKPHFHRNRSGCWYPGAALTLFECDGEIPNPAKKIGKPVYKNYDNIYALRDASAPTIFAFETPAVIKTGRFYGFGVQHHDSGFKLWINKQGGTIVGQNVGSSGKTQARDGSYYRAVEHHWPHLWWHVWNRAHNHIFDHYDHGFYYWDNHRHNCKPMNDRSMKYTVNIANYNTTGDNNDQGGNTGNSGNVSPATTMTLVNDPYEFFTVNTVSGTFTGGEVVFANNSFATGNVAFTAGNTTVLGNGTTFTGLVDGDSIVLTSGPTHHITTINTIANNTVLTINEPATFANATGKYRLGVAGEVINVDYVNQKLVLRNSTARANSVFANGNLLIGISSNTTAVIQSVDNVTVDQFTPNIIVDSGIGSNYGIKYDIASGNSGVFTVDSSFETIIDDKPVALPTHGYLLSRSNEVQQANLYGEHLKSAVVKVEVPASNSSFSAPRITSSDADIEIGNYKISNTYLTQASNGMYYDSEVNNHGNALSKHITKQWQLKEGQQAEDVRVIMVLHRPANTDIRVYTKIHNSSDNDTFDDKQWTALEVVSGANNYSAVDNFDDLVTIEYGIPSSPPVESRVAGSFTTASANAVVVGTSGSVNTAISVGRLVKISSPYFADNYLVGRVVAANTTTFTLDNPITDNDVLGGGFNVDLLQFNRTAFNNAQNSNVVRYYNSEGAAIDNFNSMQYKIVFLSDNSNIIPRVAQSQYLALSA